MFRNRKNSQKPNDELYSAFKQTLNELGPNVSAALPADNPGVTLDDPLAVPMTLAGAQDDMIVESQKSLNDQFGLTPSVMDPNSLAFSSFDNQLPTYYTQAPGAPNLYQSQAGDLQEQQMTMNLVNPLSSGLPVDGTIDMAQLQPHLAAPQQFHHIDPFPQQPSFAPSTFVHHDPIYETIDHSAIDGVNPHVNSSLGLVTNGTGVGDRMDHPSLQGNEKFRYHVTLRAPTAMVKHADEIPITYLNKGQAYTLSVADTSPPLVCPQPIKYRTYVRVSFEDEQQRSKPAACWQLWKEGRGSNEAHQRGGRLLAVEYVDPNQGGDDGNRHPQINLESASFDGFCVTWSPNPSTGNLSRDISVRFNFLSTDFSHSKGVKGIPVRLCTKTEMIRPGPLDAALAERSEVCYCKVKLFRDHGAERKLSNDVAHVRKTMDKLKQQIAQVELGAGSFGKRKRTGSFAKGSDSGRITKHKRSGSSDSQGESSGRMSVKEDLQAKLATLQDMFSSARPASLLNLGGDEQDDPDLFPVCIPQDIQQDARLDGHSQSHWDSRSVDTQSATPNILSPTTSSNSINSPGRSNDRHQPPLGNSVYNNSRHDSMDWPNVSRRGSEVALNSHKSLLNHPVKIEKASVDGSTSTDKWFEAVGVDSNYTPPSDRPPKAVACFYVRFGAADNDSDGYYRAIYLNQRTSQDLLSRISEKCKVDPTRIVRAFRIQNGRKIIIDDDVVRQLPEGQDMVVEMASPNNHSPLTPKADIEMTGTDYPTPPSVELQLIF